MSQRPTVRRSDQGEIIEELHAILAAAGLPIQGDPAAFFGAATEETVRAFQRSRAIQVDGICGPDTWAELAERRFALGDRLLASRRPMLRGDDVRELQTRLNQLGFDTGKVDAIFGPNTQAALMTFQRDAGISADGICGPATTLHLRRLGHLADGSITSVRELESIAATPRTFKARRIFVAARIHGAPSAAQLCNQLVELGANVACSLDLTHDAGAAIPAAEFDADLCVLIQPTADRDWRTAFYGSGRYRSFRGEAIAVAIARRLSVDNYGASSGTPNRAVPLQLGFLRETRMPAVVVQTTSESNAPSDETSMIAFGIKDGFEQPAPFSQ